MKPFNSVLSGYAVTVLGAMSRLAMEMDAINLGQGFLNDNGPESPRLSAA